MKGEIIIYQTEKRKTHLEVRVDEETVWLSIEQMSILFGRDRTVIGRHINNIFKERELIKELVSAFFAHTTQHGAIQGKTQTKNIEYFNLDVIISVGYRVKSVQGTQFRIWANRILKEYLLKGYSVNRRFERLEDDVSYLKEKTKEFDLQLKTSLPPNQGIFFDGQIFDSYVFVSGLIKSAKESIILIDNYVDETVLTLLTKRSKNASVTIYTQKINKQLQLDLKKHNSQYPEIQIKVLTKSHDRFLIIDEKEIYHIGASLKDLGKKWFAFSKISLNTDLIISKLNESS